MSDFRSDSETNLMRLLNSMKEMCCIGNFSFPVFCDVLILFYRIMNLLLQLKRKFTKHKKKLFQPVLVVYSGEIHTVLQSYFVYMRRSVL